MIFFLFKLLLGKALPIPLAWSFAFPTIDGDVAFQNIRVGNPPLFSAAHAEVEVYWSSLFDDELRVKRLMAKEIVAEFPVGDPAALLECLAGGRCRRELTCDGIIPALPAVPKDASEPSTKETKKTPARIFVESVRAEGGIFTFCRGKERVQLRVIRAGADDLHIPLAGGGFSANAHATLLDKNSRAKGEPIHVELNWTPPNNILKVKAQVSRFPIFPLAALFPDLVPQAGKQLPLRVGSQVIVQEIKQDITVSGELELQYDPSKAENSRWTLKLP